MLVVVLVVVVVVLVVVVVSVVGVVVVVVLVLVVVCCGADRAGAIVGVDDGPSPAGVDVAVSPQAANTAAASTGQVRKPRAGYGVLALMGPFYTVARAASRRSASRLATFSLLAIRFIRRSRASSPTWLRPSMLSTFQVRSTTGTRICS